MEITESPLSSWIAVLYCFLLSVAFVGSFYIFVPKRFRFLERNDPVLIRWRTIASLMYVVLVGIALLATIGYNNLLLNVFLVSNVWALLRVLFHTSILYLGPLAERCVELYVRTTQVGRHLDQKQGPDKKNDLAVGGIQSSIDCWVNVRNYIVAPVIEEIIFRFYTVSLLKLSSFTTKQICWIGPVFFGVAHVHHAMTQITKITNRKREEVIPILQLIALQTLFQMIYTSLFGSYVTYAYIRTTYSILAVIGCHSFCNFMGLPTFRPFFVQNKIPDSSHLLELFHRHRYVLQLAYILGLVGFVVGFSWII